MKTLFVFALVWITVAQSSYAMGKRPSHPIVIPSFPGRIFNYTNYPISAFQFKIQWNCEYTAGVLYKEELPCGRSEVFIPVKEDGSYQFPELRIPDPYQYDVKIGYSLALDRKIAERDFPSVKGVFAYLSPYQEQYFTLDQNFIKKLPQYLSAFSIYLFDPQPIQFQLKSEWWNPIGTSKNWAKYDGRETRAALVLQFLNENASPASQSSDKLPLTYSRRELKAQADLLGVEQFPKALYFIAGDLGAKPRVSIQLELRNSILRPAISNPKIPFHIQYVDNVEFNRILPDEIAHMMIDDTQLEKVDRRMDGIWEVYEMNTRFRFELKCESGQLSGQLAISSFSEPTRPGDYPNQISAVTGTCNEDRATILFAIRKNSEPTTVPLRTQIQAILLEGKRLRCAADAPSGPEFKQSYWITASRVDNGQVAVRWESFCGYY